MKILITGGCGYVGSKLVPYLLKKKYKIINIDTKWFGDFLPKDKNLKNIKCDISEISKINLKNVSCAIHLASIANDPMAEIDKNLSWETSALNSMKLAEHLISSGVKRLIYASSGSVYGVSNKIKITENTELNPISLYNKVKMITERVLYSYSNKLDLFIIRPATVCGYSKRMRLDLTVNALTFSALSKMKITVYGGKQIRPNIHIDDMVRLYEFFTRINKKYAGTYNAGFENKSIIEIAEMVKEKINCNIVINKDSNDPRSYRLNSDKLLKLGFMPSKTIDDAISEISKLYNNKILKETKNAHSLKWLKKILKQ